MVANRAAGGKFAVIGARHQSNLGRQSAGTARWSNLSLKTGTAAFHGTLYENNQNNFLNANFYQNKQTHTPVPPVHVNEFGGAVGGPVWLPKIYDGRKRKTFFFFSYNYILTKAPGSTGFMSIPTALERQGDFSQSFVVSNGVRFPIRIYDPTTISGGTRQPFSCNGLPNVICPNRISPIAAAYLKFIPAPDNAGDGANTDSNNYVKKTVMDDKMPSYALRIDQAWNNAHHSYASLRYNTWNELSFDPFGPGNPLQGLNQIRDNKGITLDHTWVLSPRLLVDFRYNVTGYRGRGQSTGVGFDATKVGFPASFAALAQRPALPQIQGIVSGAETGGLGTNQVDNGQDTFQTYDVNMTQLLNNHTFRYGYEFMVQQLGTGGLGQTAGAFNFGNNWTVQNPNGTNGTGVGSNLASLLLGLPTSGSLPTRPSAFWSQHYTALYFQDDWRATNKLTINLGLRWDYQLPLSERFDRYASRFDPNLNLQPITAFAQPNYGTLIAASSSNVGVQLLQRYRPDVSSFVARGGLLYAAQGGISRYVENPRYIYFQPRFGFAYRLLQNTVVRGGFGRFVQANFNSGGQTGYSVDTPYIVSAAAGPGCPSSGCPPFTYPANTLADPFPAGKLPITGNSLGVLTNPGGIGSFTDPNRGRVYVDEVSLHVQQQLKDYLFEIGGTLNVSHGLNPIDYRNNNTAGYQVNLSSVAVWQAAFGSQFDASGRPLSTLSGDTQVTNPFRNAPYITNGTQTSATVSAYQLLRANPIRGDIIENKATGKSTYYALQSKVERRFKNGFSLLQSFTFAKQMTQNYFKYPQSYSQVLMRELDPGDIRFHDVVTVTYELPFGHGKLFGNGVDGALDRLIGGWKLSGIYNFQSGAPLTLPTNSAFFNPDCQLSLGSRKTSAQWFNTDCFRPFPSSSTTLAQLQAYPSWTGVQNLPGYNFVPAASDSIKNGVYQDFRTWATGNSRVFGNTRNPYLTDVTLGVHKSVKINERVSMQLRMDAFNLLNHPRFGSVGTDPNGKFFGVLGNSQFLSQINAPRQIQLSGKLFF